MTSVYSGGGESSSTKNGAPWTVEKVPMIEPLSEPVYPSERGDNAWEDGRLGQNRTILHSDMSPKSSDMPPLTMLEMEDEDEKEDERVEKMLLNEDGNGSNELLDAGQLLDDASEEDESEVHDDEEYDEVPEKDVEALYNNLSTYELQLDEERFMEVEKLLEDCDNVIRESDTRLESLESFKKTISLFSDYEDDEVEYSEFLEICGPEASKGDNSKIKDEQKEQLFLTEAVAEKDADETILDEDNSKIIPVIPNKMSEITKLLQIQLADADETYARLLGQQHKNHQQMIDSAEKLDRERQDIWDQLEEENVQLQHDKEVKSAAMCKWAEDFQIAVKEELETQQIEIQKLEEFILKEKEAIQILDEEQRQRRTKAATRIQSTFRMYRTMKECKSLQEKRRGEKEKKEEEEEKARLEEERRRIEEEKEKEKQRQNEEKERQKKEEEKKKREEEEERKKIEEERRKREEEERKMWEEEERKREEKERIEREEKKKREEEEKKKREKEECERKKKEEEERKKKEEEERKKKEEEKERKKKEEEEEERKRKEEERKKKEEKERKRKEEETKKIEEEKERKKKEEEEERKRKEEERKKIEEEKERKRKEEEEERKRKEEERKKIEVEEEKKKIEEEKKKKEEEINRREKEERKIKEEKEGTRQKKCEEGEGKTSFPEEMGRMNRREEGGVKIKVDVKIKKEEKKEKDRERKYEEDVVKKERDKNVEQQGRMKDAEERMMESMQKSKDEVDEGKGENIKTIDAEEVENVKTKTKNVIEKIGNNGGKIEKQREITPNKNEGPLKNERERTSEQTKYEDGINERLQLNFEKNDTKREELKGDIEKDPIHNLDAGNKTQTIEIKNGRIKIMDKVPVSSASSEDPTEIPGVTNSFQDTNLKPLPQIVNDKRLAWMEHCLSWGKISNAPWIEANNNRPLTKVERKRPPSNKRLPKPLNEEIILSASKCTSLTQVTSVHLKNLNGFTLATLGQCPHLQCLSINNCQLLTLDGLHACSKVRYIDVKHNRVEYVNVKGMESLQVLDLSHNNLSLIHGVDGCSNLLWLNIQYNRITKFGSALGSLRRLRTLLLDHNQLMSTSGLQAGGVEMQTLDLSHNQLHKVTDIENFCLLRSLDVSCNNLFETPKLTNHVLLQNLNLSENCLSTLTELSQCWLPLLSVLNVGQNRLSSVSEMQFVNSLKIIDVSNNQLLEFAELSNAFSNCTQLERLLLHGNPFSSEPEIRDHMVQAFPLLHYLEWGSETSNTFTLEDKRSASSPRNSVLNGFQCMCTHQVAVFEKLEENFHQEFKTAYESEPPNLLSVCNAYEKWHQKSYQVSIEYRYAHEYGDSSISKFPSFEESDESGQEFELTLTNAETLETQAQVTSSASNRDPSSYVAVKSQDTRSKGQVSEAHLDCSGHDHPVVVASGAATLREHATTAPAFAKHSQTPHCSSRLSTQGKPLSQNNECKINRQRPESVKNPKCHHSDQPEESITEKVKAATFIQAVWRRYRLRVKLQADNEFAQNVYEKEEEKQEDQKECEGGGEEEEKEEDREKAEREFEEDESEYEEEINLDSFIMADDDLVNPWTVSDTPTFPLSFFDSRKPPLFRDSSQINLHFPISQDENRSNSGKNHSPIASPQQAWNSPMVSARSSHFFGSVRRPKSEEILRPSPPATKTAISDKDSDILSALDSKRKNDICKEWGFKDARTAQLMFQRAKKMKLNAERREKVKKLDPHQRLALFRKLGQAPPLLPVKSPPRKMLPKKEYFQAARELRMGLHAGYFEKVDKEEEDEVKESRTYQWIHTQITSFEQIDQRNQQSLQEKAVSQSSKKPLNTNQRISLFQRHQLSNAEGMTAPCTTDECQSIMDTENETITESRRHSIPSAKKRPVHLPPIEKSPVPTSLWSGSMSHWNPDVKRSEGWGCGKKRTKRKSLSNVAGGGK